MRAAALDRPQTGRRAAGMWGTRLIVTTSRIHKEERVIGPFVEGLVAAAAFGALTSGSGSTSSGVVMVAVGMGIAAAVFAAGGDWLRPVASVLYSGLGIIAFVPGALTFARGGACGQGVPGPLRWSVLALLIAVAAITFAAGIFTLRRPPRPAIGLALFGALQILVTAATFITGSATSPEMIALAMMVPGAFALGWFAVTATDAVLAVAGAAIAMQSIYAASTDTMCGTGNATGIVVILLYGATYFAARAVTSRFTRGR